MLSVEKEEVFKHAMTLTNSRYISNVVNNPSSVRGAKSIFNDITPSEIVKLGVSEFEIISSISKSLTVDTNISIKESFEIKDLTLQKSKIEVSIQKSNVNLKKIKTVKNKFKAYVALLIAIEKFCHEEYKALVQNKILTINNAIPNIDNLTKLISEVLKFNLHLSSKIDEIIAKKSFLLNEVSAKELAKFSEKNKIEKVKTEKVCNDCGRTNCPRMRRIQRENNQAIEVRKKKENFSIFYGLKKFFKSLYRMIF